MPAGRASLRAGAHASRRATTLIELMMALVVLTVAVGAMLSGFATLHGLRRSSSDLAKAQDLLRSLSERFEGWDAFLLGPVRINGWFLAQWSLPRFEGRFLDTAGNPIDAPAMTEEDLLNPVQWPNDPAHLKPAVADPGAVILDRPTGLRNVRVFCEYYRYERADSVTPSGEKGLLDLLNGTEATAAVGRLADAFRADVTTREQCRIDPLVPPVTRVADQQTFIVRLIVTWDDGDPAHPVTRRSETFVAKRRIPSGQ